MSAAFKVMPVQATPEMIEAGRWSEYGEDSLRLRPVDDETVAEVWAAMAEAAPDGSFVRIPANREEAEAMLRVAQLWLFQHKEGVGDAG